MISSREYHGLDLTIARFSSNRICYILLPGMDWNNVLTPWPAKGVFKKEKDFGGKASFFLRKLVEDMLADILRFEF